MKTNLPPVCPCVTPRRPVHGTHSWSSPAAGGLSPVRWSPAVKTAGGSEHCWTNQSGHVISHCSISVNLSRCRTFAAWDKSVLPGPSQEVPDALGPAGALFQLLWTRQFIWVRFYIALWDGNFLRFGQLHVGNTGSFIWPHSYHLQLIPSYSWGFLITEQEAPFQWKQYTKCNKTCYTSCDWTSVSYERMACIQIMYTSVLIHSWLVCTDGEVKSPESSVCQGRGSRCSFLDFNPSHNPKFSLSLVQRMEGLLHSLKTVSLWRPPRTATPERLKCVRIYLSTDVQVILHWLQVHFS